MVDHDARERCMMEIELVEDRMRGVDRDSNTARRGYRYTGGEACAIVNP